MNGIVVYKGKYGATQQYANWLGDDLQIPVCKADDITSESLAPYDYIFVGSSVYIGKLQLRDWIRANAALLQTKKLYFFIVCATSESEHEKIAAIINNNIPELLQDKNIYILPGKMIMKNLSWLDRLMLKMGAKMQKDPDVRDAMLRDFNMVEHDRLLPLLKSLWAKRHEAEDVVESKFSYVTMQ